VLRPLQTSFAYSAEIPQQNPERKLERKVDSQKDKQLVHGPPPSRANTLTLKNRAHYEKFPCRVTLEQERMLHCGVVDGLETRFFCVAVMLQCNEQGSSRIARAPFGV